MVSFDQLMSGVSKFIETEIISVLPGWKKWAAGAAVSLALDRSSGLFASLKNNPVVHGLGLIRDDGMIDVETLYKHFRDAAQKTGPVSIDIPMAGSFKMSHADVDRLYQLIVGG